MPTHDRPPFVVRTTDVQGLCVHGAVPRTQPSFADTNVKESGWKPAGTGPTAGLAEPGAAPAETAADAVTAPAPVSASPTASAPSNLTRFAIVI
jgi:hypothetical protein